MNSPLPFSAGIIYSFSRKSRQAVPAISRELRGSASLAAISNAPILFNGGNSHRRGAGMRKCGAQAQNGDFACAVLYFNVFAKISACDLAWETPSDIAPSQVLYF